MNYIFTFVTDNSCILTGNLLYFVTFPYGHDHMGSQKKKKKKNHMFILLMSFFLINYYCIQGPGSEEGVDSATDSSKFEKAWLLRIWSQFDVRYMKPFLTNSRPTLLDTTPLCCAPLARLLTTTEQLTQV